MNKLMGNGGTKSMSPVTEEPENVSLHLVWNAVYRHYFHKINLGWIILVCGKPLSNPQSLYFSHVPLAEP